MNFPAGLVVASVLVISTLSIVSGCGQKQSTASSKSKQKAAAAASDDVKEERLEWNIRTLVEAYEKAGHANPAWDQFAKRALTQFARSRSGLIGTNEPTADIINLNCNDAVKAGCKDPMIRYLHIRYVPLSNGSKDKYAAGFSDIARDMQQSSYPSIRKFYAALRAAEQGKYAAGTNTPPAVHEFRRTAIDQLVAAFEDKTMPPGEVYDGCHELLEELERNKTTYRTAYESLEKPLFAKWDDEHVSWLIKGEAYVRFAWQARGSGYSDKVTEEGWRDFSENLEVAETALKKAWDLNPTDPKIAIKMLSVELGKGKDRKQMELWFARAMDLNPNSYDACDAKRNYLEPKWHGSAEELLKFGRECVQNRDWGGHVPLILYDAHHSIASYYKDKAKKEAYWEQPEVWADLQSAFDRFFQLNPGSIGWYHNYAFYAYKAKEWGVLNDVLPKLGEINHSYFGGEAEYDKIVQAAKQHASAR